MDSCSEQSNGMIKGTLENDLDVRSIVLEFAMYCAM